MKHLCIGLCFMLTPLISQAAWQDEARVLIEAQRYNEANVLLRQELSRHPEQAEARYLLARNLSWQGQYEAAEAEYQTLLQAEPGNTDYMLGLAQVRVWSQRPQQALALLEQARTLNPDDADLWRLNIQALVALGEAQREAALALQSQAAARFPDRAWNMVPQQAPELAEAPIRLEPLTPVPDAIDRRFAQAQQQQFELSASRDRLSNGNASWQGLRLDFEHRFEPRKLVYGALSESKRFGLCDYELLGGFYYPLSPRVTLNAETSWNPEHKVLPKHTALASVQYAFDHGWVLSGGVRQAEYDDASVTQLPFVLERYFGAYRIAYGLTPAFVEGETLDSHNVQFSYYYNDISFINLSVSRGEEATQIGTRFVTTDVDFIGFNGRHWFNPAWALTWELAHTKQGSFYDRTGVRFGLRRAF